LTAFAYDNIHTNAGMSMLIVLKFRAHTEHTDE